MSTGSSPPPETLAPPPRMAVDPSRHRRRRRKKRSSRVKVPVYRWWHVLVAIGFAVAGILFTRQLIKRNPQPNVEAPGEE